MESRLDSELEIGPFAAMAVDAGVESTSIGVVVMAPEAIDGDMLAMIEVQRQRLRAPHERFTQRDISAARDEHAERDDGCAGDAGDECRMTPEREAAHES